MKANKEQTMIIERREFTLGAVLAMLAGATITISGCGGDDNPPSSPSTPAPSGDKMGQISANHGHTVTINSADLTAGAGVTLTLTTGDGHMHTVTLDATEVVQIRNNQRVSKPSSTTFGHSHTVTFN